VASAVSNDLSKIKHQACLFLVMQSTIFVSPIEGLVSSASTRRRKCIRPGCVSGHNRPAVSWLNQIACWFSILSRQALQGASFVDVKQPREAIDHFISSYNE
jgi:hypothetical protein